MWNYVHFRAVVSGGAGGVLAPPEFGSSVNSIPNRGVRLCPPHYCQHPWIRKPKDLHLNFALHFQIEKKSNCFLFHKPKSISENNDPNRYSFLKLQFHIVSSIIFLLGCRNYSRIETIQRRKLFEEIHFLTFPACF